MKMRMMVFEAEIVTWEGSHCERGKLENSGHVGSLESDMASTSLVRESH